MYKEKIYEGVKYRAWVGKKVGERFGYLDNDIALYITPDNIKDISERVTELHQAIAFDRLLVECPDKTRFNSSHSFKALAPYVKSISIEDSCGRVDFEIFETLVNLCAFGTFIPKPKKLRLNVYPKLKYVGLGQVDKAEVIEGAQQLEELKLFRKLHIDKVGWDWLQTLPSLKVFWIVQSELQNLIDIPTSKTIEKLSIAFPRGLTSIEGINSFVNLRELELEGAKQLHDYSPVASLKKLEYLGIIGSSGRPDSTDFINSLPLIEEAVIGNYEYIKVDGSLVKRRY